LVKSAPLRIGAWPHVAWMNACEREQNDMKVKVAGVGTAALLGLAGCGSGGGDEYGSAQELWDSLSPVASCPSDGLNIEEMPAEGDLAAHSRVDCYPTTTDGGVEIEVYGLVVEDGEQLESVADYY